MNIEGKLEEIINKLTEIEMGNQSAINLMAKNVAENAGSILQIRSDIIKLRYELAELKGKVGRVEINLDKIKQL